MAQPRFQLVPGARLAHSATPGGVGWRLLGANNRELGRSSGAFPDAEVALASIARLREISEVAEAHIVHDPSSGLWEWHLYDDGVAVSNSGRGFRHERECRYNLEQFRTCAPTSPASDSEVPLEFPWQRTVVVAPQSDAAV